MEASSTLSHEVQIDLGLEESGIDSEGFVYKNAKDMWAREIEKQVSEVSTAQPANSKVIGDINSWYSGALKYWEVRTNLPRILRLTIMEFWAVLGIHMTLISKIQLHSSEG